SFSVVQMNLSQYLLTGGGRPLIYPQNLGALCRAHDDIRRSIPLISEHLSGLGRKAKPFCAFSKLVFRLMTLLYKGCKKHERCRSEDQEDLERQDVAERFPTDEGAAPMDCAPNR